VDLIGLLDPRRRSRRCRAPSSTLNKLQVIESSVVVLLSFFYSNKSPSFAISFAGSTASDLSNSAIEFKSSLLESKECCGEA
jgi:hypothetical protein